MEEGFSDPEIKDTGNRIEPGWSSRQRYHSVAGREIVVYQVNDDVRDDHGAAIHLTLGGRRN